jgi:hypothetical protein
MVTKRKTPPPPGLSAADVERLDTWMPEIAEEARSNLCDETNGSFRAGADRGLVINPGGTFYDFTASKGGRGAVELIQQLRGCDPIKAVTIAKEYLAQHPGTGSLSGSVDVDEDAAIVEDDLRRTTEINEIWQAAQPIDGSPAETYLKSRGLDPDRQDREQLRQLKNGLTGSVFMLAAITATDGALVGLQETLLTTDGKKADVKVVRRTMRGPHDWNVRGLVRFGNPRAKTVFICEGVEDALSTRAAGAEYAVALTGIARLRRIDIPDHVEAIVLVRDDDAPGSPADDALWRGIVAMMGKTDSRMVVKITPKPSSLLVSNVVSLQAPKTVVVSKDVPAGLKDVNDLHQYDHALVKTLLDAATERPFGLPENTINLIIDETCNLKRTPWQRGRERIAKLIGWKVSALDKERDTRIAMRSARAEKEGAFQGADETPWPDPVTDIAAVLDAVVAEICRYIRADITLLRAAVLWSVFAHAVHRIDLKINISPRLSIQSARSDSGKSTLLELLACLTPRADIVGSTTTASIFRKIGVTGRPTLLIDEADNILHSDAQPELKAVLNSGHRRTTAFAERTEKTPSGGWEVVKFPTFTGIAYAGIVGIGKARMPETLLNRSIIIFLLPATSDEQPEHLVDGESEALYAARRKIARFVADIEEMPKIDPRTCSTAAGTTGIHCARSQSLSAKTGLSMRWMRRPGYVSRVPTRPRSMKSSPFWRTFGRSSLSVVSPRCTHTISFPTCLRCVTASGRRPITANPSRKTISPRT